MGKFQVVVATARPNIPLDLVTFEFEYEFEAESFVQRALLAANVEYVERRWKQASDPQTIARKASAS